MSSSHDASSSIFNFKFWRMVWCTEEWWILVSRAIWRVVLWPYGAPSWLKINSLTESTLSSVRGLRHCLLPVFFNYLNNLFCPETIHPLPRNSFKSFSTIILYFNKYWLKCDLHTAMPKLPINESDMPTLTLKFVQYYYILLQLLQNKVPKPLFMAELLPVGNSSWSSPWSKCRFHVWWQLRLNTFLNTWAYQADSTELTAISSAPSLILKCCTRHKLKQICTVM